MNTKRLTKLVAVALVLVMALTTLVACPKPVVTPAEFKQAEYNTTTTVMPSNWNELTYADNNDTQILGYISSSFFDYDYKFEGGKYKEDGSINKEGIVNGAYTTNYSAATKLEDVTSSVDAKWGYTDKQKQEGGYAWKITLRDDLKWQNGDPISAADFLYSMQQALDPEFMNFRAETYYKTLRIKGAKNYFFQNQEVIYETIGSQGYSSNQEAVDDGAEIYIDVKTTDEELFGLGLLNLGLVDENGNPLPRYLAYNDERVFDTPEGWASGSYSDNAIDAATMWSYVGPQGAYGAYTEVGGDYTWLVIGVENVNTDVSWDEVGMYVIEEENAIVVCLDLSFQFLQDNGDLSYLAAYNLSGLPLVHRATYEANKHDAVEGATLKTSTYNSDLASTMSWGPYYLVEFEAGSHFRLEKNPYWFGWGMEQYKNQYNVTAIYTRRIEDDNTKWLGFLAGEYDDGALTLDNIKEYYDSKYVYYAATTGTFGMQLYSNLPVLKASDNNNGILAIDEFRQAFNLAINRSAVIENIWPGTAAPCFGLLCGEYYYDIENSPNLEDGGRYRNNPIAKAGILRAYGYTEAADGTWSINDLVGLTLDEAYETLTGYNPTLAKEKLKAAIEILEADPEYYGYDSSKEITLVYGSSSPDSTYQDRCNYLQTVVDELAKGTKLEGKIKLKFDASAGSKWAEAFRSGQTQIGFGYGFKGNPFNPFDIVGGFVNPDDDLNYHMYWDTSAIDMTLTMPAGDYEGAGETITMSVQNWYYCLNGLAEDEGMEHTYNWGAGKAPVEARLTVLSALEELTIKESRSVMLCSDAGGSLLGAKFSYFSDENNVFMGFGGLRYLVVNYTDAEWAEYVEANNGDLSTEYQKSE